MSYESDLRVMSIKAAWMADNSAHIRRSEKDDIRYQRCGVRDSNPRTPARRDLKSRAFGQLGKPRPEIRLAPSGKQNPDEDRALSLYASGISTFPKAMRPECGQKDGSGLQPQIIYQGKEKLLGQRQNMPAPCSNCPKF